MLPRGLSLSAVAAATLGALAIAGCASGTQGGFGDSGNDVAVNDAHAHPKADAARDGTTHTSMACVPGRQLTCGCPGGGVGYQVCTREGAGYGPCTCKEAGADATGDARSDGTRVIADAPADHERPDTGHDAHRGDAPHDSATLPDVHVGPDAVAEAGQADASSCPLAIGDAGTGGTVEWGVNFGTTGLTWPTSVAVDPTSGDIVVAGFFNGTVSFGGSVLTSHGDAAAGDDTFVARFDKNGDYKWAKDFGNGLLTSANSVAIDGAGNVVIGGGFKGTLSFGGASPLVAVGDIDIFVVQLDPSGAYGWGSSYGAADQDQQLDTVAVDGDGNILFGGTAVDVDFGSGPGTGFYMTKLTQTGAPVWSTTIPGSCAYGNLSLAVDRTGGSGGDVILAGCFLGTANFGAGLFTSRSGGDAFVAKYNSAGMNLWANDYAAVAAMGGSGSDVSNGGLAVDGCGGIYVLGSFGATSGSATIDFGAPETLTSGVDTMFLAKLDPSGHGAWNSGFAAATERALSPGALAVDARGNVTLAAGLAGSINYGGGTLTSLGTSTSTLSLASFDTNGSYRWSYAERTPSTAPSSGVASPQGLAAQGSALVVAGAFGGCVANCTDGVSPAGTTLVLPGKTLTAVSAGDMFLATFSP